MTRQVKINFVEPDRRYSRRFERYVLDLSKHMTMTHVAHHLGISWHTFKEIHKRYLLRRFPCSPLSGLQRVAVDEISIGDGHQYLTVVLDLDHGRSSSSVRAMGLMPWDPFGEG
jgi:transposase